MLIDFEYLVEDQSEPLSVLKVITKSKLGEDMVTSCAAIYYPLGLRDTF